MLLVACLGRRLYDCERNSGATHGEMGLLSRVVGYIEPTR
jgi:hypothetical protein